MNEFPDRTQTHNFYASLIIIWRMQNTTVVGSIPTRGDEYFHFFVLTPRQNPGVEFCHSTRNASKSLAENGESSPSSLCLPWYMWRQYTIYISVKLIQIVYQRNVYSLGQLIFKIIINQLPVLQSAYSQIKQLVTYNYVSYAYRYSYIRMNLVSIFFGIRGTT